jgi:hypothetical protein
MSDGYGLPTQGSASESCEQNRTCARHAVPRLCDSIYQLTTITLSILQFLKLEKSLASPEQCRKCSRNPKFGGFMGSDLVQSRRSDLSTRHSVGIPDASGSTSLHDSVVSHFIVTCDSTTVRPCSSSDARSRVHQTTGRHSQLPKF